MLQSKKEFLLKFMFAYGMDGVKVPVTRKHTPIYVTIPNDPWKYAVYRNDPYISTEYVVNSDQWLARLTPLALEELAK